MVNQSKCQCTDVVYKVSDILVSSGFNSLPFFMVIVECVECGEFTIVAEYTMSTGDHFPFFKEYHEKTKGFYEGEEA